MLGWKFYDKTVKELRKNQSLTAQELARLVNAKPSLILRIDEMRLRNVPEPLQSRITPALKGKHIDKIP